MNTEPLAQETVKTLEQVLDELAVDTAMLNAEERILGALNGMATRHYTPATDKAAFLMRRRVKERKAAIQQRLKWIEEI